MKRRLRVRRRTDFESAVHGMRVHSGAAIVGFAVARPGEESRVGVTTSRSIKGAVARNRARRRLREVSRAILERADSPLTRRGIGYDVILIARPAALAVPFADLKAEVEQAALRLSALTP